MKPAFFPRQFAAVFSVASAALVGAAPVIAPTVLTPAVATEAVTSIADIQGTGSASPLNGQTVTTRGVVTAVYANGGLKGFTIQTPGTGGSSDPTAGASDGLFIYSPQLVSSVKIGEYVEVTGKISEYYGQTQMTVNTGDLSEHTEAHEVVTPKSGTFPEGDAQREALESELVQPTGDVTVTDNYNINRYGEIALTNGTTPLRTATDVVKPGAEANAYEVANQAKDYILDDGATVDYSRAGQNTPLPYLSQKQPVRVGSAVKFTQPTVVFYSHDEWRLNPTTPVTGATDPANIPASFTNTRTAQPENVGGKYTIASFNVLNYFTTTGDKLTGCTFFTDRAKNPITVNNGCDARGAANEENLQRQQAKIVAAINTMSTSVLSLEEIENSAAFGKNRDEALNNLVTALNKEAGYERWKSVASPSQLPATEDVIRTAFIFQPQQVQPKGNSEILLDSPAFDNARRPLEQAFEPVGSKVAGDEFVAIVNHFKSKGSGSGENADQNDGQGASNASRIAQAHALVDFANKAKKENKTENVVLLGDFNAYSKEDPIQVLAQAGYVDLGEQFNAGYSYVFGGRQGSLDHVLTTSSMLKNVTGTDVWNINSVESIAFEYSRFNYNATNFYTPDAYRSSDHDPKIVGFNLPAPNVKGFKDVHPGDAFYSDISWLGQTGITTGWDDGTFRPQDQVARNQMAAFFYRLAGSPEYIAPATSPFKDVATTDPFYKEISWMAQQGIAKGWDDGTFRPNEPVHRGAMAAFFYRLAGSPYYVAPKTSNFSDVKTSDLFAKEVSWLASCGITTGWDDGTFRPQDAITRDAMAAFIYRFDHNVGVKTR
ncbi:MAG: ExeM/NucH family extracellular endonuclease [Rothia sp. (in: high G+C Gram-positive bacteria)]|nr:ExeM/NucH family extracellular endonuclease [Rothia sp. (in: high G+C Gram-positive bacteria)]